MSDSPPRPLRQSKTPGAQGPRGRGPEGQGSGGQAPGPRTGGSRDAGGGPGRGGGPRRPGQGRAHRTMFRAAFFALAAVAVAAAVAWALLGSRFLIVRSVRVTGTGPQVSRARVLAAARIPVGLPLIRVNTGAAAKRVEQIQQVQSARVSRAWPSTIVISVRLRTPVFAVSQPGGYALIDASGVAVRQSGRIPPGFPLLTVGSVGFATPAATGSGASRAGSGRNGNSGTGTGSGTGNGGRGSGSGGTGSGAARSRGAPMSAESLRGSPDVRAAAAVLHELPTLISRQVRAVWAASPSDVSVRLAGGVVIVWGDTARRDQKVRELALLMHTHARLYDVSGPGTAVTKG